VFFISDYTHLRCNQTEKNESWKKISSTGCTEDFTKKLKRHFTLWP